MFNYFNERVKKLNIWDIGLTKATVFFATIVIVKLLPVLLKIDYPILIVLAVLCAIIPLYSFWFRK
ncbi:MAG: hypothetical protein KKB81_01610 [Candidatus Margulisbacteria bacterium]|nr:hypothetical protein [Candidatus Margulisiibacteriota bacterium]MBU1021612.1 hypothetical protein [Candidatus Margulisiibacteriota bacterium]MBU1728763.1 hypothetical protein [Candidatus Margulisiibacteriota bacterium]MBU1955729.1 hypothetical protein [Candidatus Margulisiibacteriota bacterium]